MKLRIPVAPVFVLLSCLAVMAWGQDTSIPNSSPPAGASMPGGGSLAQAASGAAGAAPASSGFGMALNLGYETILDGNRGEAIGWQKVGLQPDVGTDAFGIGIDLVFHFRFNGGDDGQSFQIRTEDWAVGPTFQNFLEVYLPKIRYLRAGQKGGSAYLLLGDIDNGLLGNGFIVGGYNNTLFQPGQRIFGMNFDIDGAAFDFPYVGFESMVSNLAALDILAARVYVRPGAKTGLAAFEGTQIGFTFAADTDPHYYDTDPVAKANAGGAHVIIGGIDFRQPIVPGDLFNLSLYGDAAMENTNVGAQIGFGGTIIKVLNYNAAIRYNGNNFIPDYFDYTYDLMRMEKYAVYSNLVSIPSYAGWLASLGFSFLNDALVFNASMDGPFNPDPSVLTQNPNLKAVLTLKEGVLDGFSVSAGYNKKYITKPADIIDPTNAQISATIGYRLGPALVSLVYDVTYDENQTGNQKWKVTSHIDTSIILF